MLREALLAVVLMLGLTHSAVLHRKRVLGLWGDLSRSRELSSTPWQNEGSRHKDYFLVFRNDFEHLVRMRKSDSGRQKNSLLRRLQILHSVVDPQLNNKRLALSCDTTRITIQTILEYLRSGRICGFRVTTVRFGLGGRR